MDPSTAVGRHRIAFGLVSLLAFVAVTLLPASPAHALVRLRVPEESPGGPFYARIGIGPNVPHDDQWAAIVFYRDPACVPEDFNLLNFFDPPPRPFLCPLTVRGFEVWERGPGQDPAPVMTNLREAGPVPVWFVSWPVLQAAMADGVLTITELASLPTVVTGVANRYREILRPSEAGRRTSSLQISASGHLSDGRSFRLNVQAVGRAGNPPTLIAEHVTIRFE